MLVSTIKNHPPGEYLELLSLKRPIFKSHCLMVEKAGVANDDIQPLSILNTFVRQRKPAELPRKHLIEIKTSVTVY